MSLPQTTGEKPLKFTDKKSMKSHWLSLISLCQRWTAKCLDEILRIDPGAKVLIASGFSPDRATKESLEGGAKGFVGKPYNVKQLLEPFAMP